MELFGGSSLKEVRLATHIRGLSKQYYYSLINKDHFTGMRQMFKGY